MSFLRTSIFSVVYGALAMSAVPAFAVVRDCDYSSSVLASSFYKPTFPSGQQYQNLSGLIGSTINATAVNYINPGSIAGTWTPFCSSQPSGWSYTLGYWPGTGVACVVSSSNSLGCEANETFSALTCARESAPTGTDLGGTCARTYVTSVPGIGGSGEAGNRPGLAEFAARGYEVPKEVCGRWSSGLDGAFFTASQINGAGRIPCITSNTAFSPASATLTYNLPGTNPGMSPNLPAANCTEWTVTYQPASYVSGGRNYTFNPVTLKGCFSSATTDQMALVASSYQLSTLTYDSVTLPRSVSINVPSAPVQGSACGADQHYYYDGYAARSTACIQTRSCSPSDSNIGTACVPGSGGIPATWLYVTPICDPAATSCLASGVTAN